jgi:DNA polymerase-3 subunit epsilon
MSNWMTGKPESCERSIELSKALAFLDLETTGSATGTDRIVEIGVFKVTPEGGTLEFQSLVNPEIPIPTEVTSVHGIRDDDVRRCPTFAAIAAQLKGFLSDCDFAGFNLVRFDLPILQAEFLRVGQPFDIDGCNVIDLMAIFHQREPRDLKAAHQFYCGSEHKGAHSAFADARACWNILRCQLSMYPDLPVSPAGLGAVIADYRKQRTQDSGGWFEMRHGKPALARGKHRGALLSEVAGTDREYLKWMLSLDLPEDTISVIRQILPECGKQQSHTGRTTE